jgi:arginyl-tRNA synthetase
MDHHSTVVRVRAGLQALGIGIPAGYPDYVLHKLVTVMKDGEEMKISKRAGSYVTVRDLIDEVGRDAVRFFLVSRKADTEFTFDIDLAKSQSEENPVYYVQYAHARVWRMLEEARARFPEDPASFAAVPLDALAEPRELALLARLGDFRRARRGVGRARAAPDRVLPANWRRLPQLLYAVRVLVPESDARLARLALSAAVKQVLANGLAVLGVSAPERM